MVHISKSLLEAWQYMYDCHEGFEDDAYESFLKTLRREPEEPTEAMQNGLEFEDRVYRLANGGTLRSDAKWQNGAKMLAELIKGAQIQVPLQRTIEVDGETYLLKGVLDALKAGIIYDVKFLNKSMSGVDVYGKYLNCSQHPAYFYLVPEAREFKYLVSDGDDVYIEAYSREQTRHISEFIHDFLEDMRAKGLMDVFREAWAV